MSKITAKADIDFEKELWDAANELRGLYLKIIIKTTFYPSYF